MNPKLNRRRLSLSCFVVCRTVKDQKPLRVFVDLDSKRAFTHAGQFARSFNKYEGNCKSVIRPGTADLAWQTDAQV